MRLNSFKTGRFTRKEHIKSTVDIKNLFQKGKRVSIYGAKLFFTENKTYINRVAFTLSRNYGNAVQRNISKRYSREAYRYLKDNMKKGYDILCFIYPGNDCFDMRYLQFQQLFIKAGIIKK